MERFEIVFLKPQDDLREVPADPYENPLSWLAEDEDIERVFLKAATEADAFAEAERRLEDHPAVQQAYAFCLVDREREVMTGLSLLMERWIGRVDQDSLERLFGEAAPPRERH